MASAQATRIRKKASLFERLGPAIASLSPSLKRSKSKKSSKKRREKDKNKENSLFKEPMARNDVIADYDKPLATSALFDDQGIYFLDRLQALRIGATKLKALLRIQPKKRVLKEENYNHAKSVEICT